MPYTPPRKKKQESLDILLTPLSLWGRDGIFNKRKARDKEVLRCCELPGIFNDVFNNVPSLFASAIPAKLYLVRVLQVEEKGNIACWAYRRQRDIV